MSNDAPDPLAFERPHPDLMRYYVYCALMTLFGAPFVIIPYWFRYMTLRYKIDEDGISMRWGVLFRREVYLTYRRIQDIHVTRNLLERWMGLAKISLQTAAGSNQAELVIEGNKQPEVMRDFLYGKMRGARNESLHAIPTATVVEAGSEGLGVATPSAGGSSDDVLQLLSDIRDALGAVAQQRGIKR